MTSIPWWKPAAAVLVLALAVVSGPTVAYAAGVRVTQEFGRLGAASQALAVDTRSGLVFVADPATDSIVVTDPIGGSAQWAFPSVGQRPVALRIDTFARRLYVLNRDTPSVTIFDLGTSVASFHSIIPLQDRCSPDDMVLDSVGHQAFVTDARCGTVWVVDTSGPTVVRDIPMAGPGSIAIDPGRRVVWVANGFTKTLDSFDADTLLPLQTIDHAEWANNIELDLDHHRIYYTVDSELISVDTTDFGRRTSVTGQFDTIDSGLDKEHQQLYLLKSAGILQILDVSGPPMPVAEVTVSDGRSEAIALDTQIRTAYVLCAFYRSIRAVA